MTPTELARVIDYCEDRWPGTRNFRSWEKAAWDFGGIPAEAVHEAAQHHFNAGERTAPTLSQLRADGARIASQRGLIDPTASSCEARGHHGAWAIEDLRDRDGNLKHDPEGHPMREAMCVDCHHIIRRSAKTLLTVGEVEDLNREPSAPADPIAERISP